MIKQIESAIEKFAGVNWTSSGYPVEGETESATLDVGWVKFTIERSELGWNTLEFLAWICNDLTNGGERVEFVPIAAPPYLNTPGDSLCFVLEVHPQVSKSEQFFAQTARFIDACRDQYWAASYGPMRA